MRIEKQNYETPALCIVRAEVECETLDLSMHDKEGNQEEDLAKRHDDLDIWDNIGEE